MDEVVKFSGCNLTEAQLIESLNKREAKAFDAVFNMYMGRLYHFANSFTPSEAITEDLTVSSFEAMWQDDQTKFTNIQDVKKSLFDYLKQQCMDLSKTAEDSYLVDSKQMTQSQLQDFMELQTLKSDIAFYLNVYTNSTDKK